MTGAFHNPSHIWQMLTKPVDTRTNTATHCWICLVRVGKKYVLFKVQHSAAEDDPLPSILQLNIEGLTTIKISVASSKPMRIRQRSTALCRWANDNQLLTTETWPECECRPWQPTAFHMRSRKVPLLTTLTLSCKTNEVQDSCLQGSGEALELLHPWMIGVAIAFLQVNPLGDCNLRTQQTLRRHTRNSARACYLLLKNPSHMTVTRTMCHVGTKSARPFIAHFFQAPAALSLLSHIYQQCRSDGKKLSVPSTSCTPAAKCGAASINVLVGLDTPACALFQQTTSLQYSWRTGHTRWRTTRLIKKKVSNLWKFATPSLAPCLHARGAC